jgi:hypothetical protein
MNDLSQLETRLRSWTPRRPAAALKARIFESGTAVIDDVAEPIARRLPAWQWLAPSMAVFVVAMMSWGEGPHSSFISSSESLSTSAWRDPQLAASQIENNIWPVATFSWTNDRQNLSTAAPVLVTNSTIP